VHKNVVRADGVLGTENLDIFVHAYEHAMLPLRRDARLKLGEAVANSSEHDQSFVRASGARRVTVSFTERARVLSWKFNPELS
jgi:hypothetical protein